VKRIHAVLFIILAVLPGCSQRKNVSVAPRPVYRVTILEFRARGVTEQEATALTDRMQEEVDAHISSERYRRSDADAYVTVDRSGLVEMMKRYGIERLGAIPDSLAATIEKMSPVDRIVMGHLYFVDPKYYINARIVDVGKGTIITSIHHEHDGSFDSLIERGSRDVAGKLFPLRR